MATTGVKNAYKGVQLVAEKHGWAKAFMAYYNLLLDRYTGFKPFVGVDEAEEDLQKWGVM